MTRDELVKAIERLTDARSEAEIEPALEALSRAVPSAEISNLIFHGERERSIEEIADEALLREKIWREGGISALQTHIENQMIAVLADPTNPENHHTKISARMRGPRSRSLLGPEE